MKIKESILRQLIREELVIIEESIQNNSSKRNPRIKESTQIRLTNLLMEVKLDDEFLNSYIDNPETGNRIKIKSALGYDKGSSVYQAAKAAAQSYIETQDSEVSTAPEDSEDSEESQDSEVVNDMKEVLANARADVMADLDEIEAEGEDPSNINIKELIGFHIDDNLSF